MNQEIHFVTGKGGVGKSAIAAALALKLSRMGRRVLLVELGEQSFYRDFFELNQVLYSPQEIRQNLSLALWSGDSCLKEYALHLIKVESITKLFFNNPVMRAFINVAPALSELAILGKITSGLRNHGPALPYDSIVVDAFATGHFKALLEAPKGMAQAVQFGPMGEQSRQIDKCIHDSNSCHYHIVTLPEELPCKEATELLADLKSKFNINADLIMNKVLEIPISEESLLQLSEKKVGPMSEFIDYLKHHFSRQEKLKSAFENSSSPTYRVKYIPNILESDPWKLIELIAEKL